jgi:hypothetical protein
MPQPSVRDAWHLHIFARLLSSEDECWIPISIERIITEFINRDKGDIAYQKKGMQRGGSMHGLVAWHLQYKSAPLE